MTWTPDTPAIPTLVSQAAADVDAALGAEAALSPSSPEYVLAAVAAGLAFGCYGKAKAVARNIIPSTANDRQALDEHARNWLGNEDGRREASPANLPITGTGTAGTVIPPGTQWRAGDGAVYATIVELVFGTDQVVVQSIAAPGETGFGASGNKTPGTSLTLIDEVAGLDSEWTVDGDPADGPIGGGADEETDEALVERIEFTAQNPPGGGTRADFERWAREANAGVGRAWAYAGLSGPGTVDIFFIRSDPDSPIPDNTLVDVVKDYVRARAPLMAKVGVSAPVAWPIDITVAIKPNTAAVREAVTASLRETIALLRDIGNGSRYFDRSWLTDAISRAVGEAGHTMTIPAADLTPPLGRLPTLGTITFSTKA